LKPEALAVKVAMQDISYATRLSVVDALAFFTGLPNI
jgi:excinuclease ABC subunit A